jgi:ubiquinone/menaquinone biosynthesis C-methylase UbiE
MKPLKDVLIPMSDSREVKKVIQTQFGKNAAKYVTSETHAKSDDLTLLTDWLEPQASWVVLDVATGGGHVAKQLAPLVDQVFAVDLTREMLQAAQEHVSQYAANVSYVVADAEDLPFLDCTFNAVTCRIAAHHFPNPQQFIREAARVLKPGGKLLLIDNIAPDQETIDIFINKLEKLRDHSHVRCYRKAEWLTWMKEAGLQEINSRERKKHFKFPAWVERTTETAEQMNQVKESIMQATPEIKAYIELVIEEDEIASFAIDEWMVLLTKDA